MSLTGIKHKQSDFHNVHAIVEKLVFKPPQFSHTALFRVHCIHCIFINQCQWLSQIEFRIYVVSSVDLNLTSIKSGNTPSWSSHFNEISKVCMTRWLSATDASPYPPKTNVSFKLLSFQPSIFLWNPLSEIIYHVLQIFPGRGIPPSKKHTIFQRVSEQNISVTSPRRATHSNNMQISPIFFTDKLARNNL